MVILASCLLILAFRNSFVSLSSCKLEALAFCLSCSACFYFNTFSPFSTRHSHHSCNYGSLEAVEITVNPGKNAPLKNMATNTSMCKSKYYQLLNLTTDLASDKTFWVWVWSGFIIWIILKLLAAAQELPIMPVLFLLKRKQKQIKLFQRENRLL